MIYKDIVIIVISVLAFLLGGVLVYWRENKKSFQEKVFEYKYLAYKDILEQIGVYYQEVYAFLDEFQHFDGTVEEWTKIFQEECPEYYSKARQLDRLYFKYLSLLPENQLNKLRALTRLANAHVTSHFHFKTSLPHDSYDKLWEMFIDFAETARKDLSTNILNATLNKRLSQQFYPISISRKKPDEA